MCFHSARCFICRSAQSFFSKNLYSSSNRLFSFTFLAVLMHHMHETIPCQNETLFRNNICHLHVASASAQPTMIVCPTHVLTFVLPCIILHRLLVIRVRFFITVFCNVQPFPFNFVLEYFHSIECNLPAAVHEKLLDTGYLA